MFARAGGALTAASLPVLTARCNGVDRALAVLRLRAAAGAVDTILSKVHGHGAVAGHAQRRPALRRALCPLRLPEDVRGGLAEEARRVGPPVLGEQGAELGAGLALPLRPLACQGIRELPDAPRHGGAGGRARGTNGARPANGIKMWGGGDRSSMAVLRKRWEVTPTCVEAVHACLVASRK